MQTHSDELALFVAVVEAGSFRQAAENLALDNSVVSRKLKRLEQKLDTTLLQRTTRQFTLTAEGEWFYQQAVTILNNMSHAEETLRARQQQPEGLLRIDAATPFILHQLVPLMGAFRRAYPKIILHLESSEGFINLLEHRVDVAIRIGALSDSTLHAMPLGTSRLRILAAPSYLAKFGVPQSCAELAQHRLLGFTNPESLNEWPAGQEERMRITPTLRASSGETLRQLALAGEGIVCLSDFMSHEDRQAGRLQEILPKMTQGATRPVNAVFYADAARSPRLRAWLDFLREELKEVEL